MVTVMLWMIGWAISMWLVIYRNLYMDGSERVSMTHVQLWLWGFSIVLWPMNVIHEIFWWASKWMSGR